MSIGTASLRDGELLEAASFRDAANKTLIPMISVVIPLYNKEKQIANTLRSVFAQTYTNYEIIVVNDGSTDNSVAVVESLNDPRIRLIHQKNAGVSAARNRGIEEARGEYIAFLDGDDQWKPRYLETITNLIKKYPECDVFATNYEFIDHKRNVKPTIINNIPFKESDGILTNYFKVAATSHPPLWTSAVVVKKIAINNIGNFPYGIKAGEDLLTWTKLAINYKIAYNISPSAFFLVDDTVQNLDQKERKPAEFDYVGKEFKDIYHKNKNIIGLKKYVSLWHKMRCRIFISKHMRLWAFKESVIALRFDINNKNIVFFILSILPHKISNKIINKFS